MRLRDFAVVGIVAMVVFQLVTSFASINLLTRMSPAIEHILSENVASNTAAEDMLVCLTASGELKTKQNIFLNALRRARQNVTEPEESIVLDTVEKQVASALAGDAVAVSVIATALHELTRINRMSMRRADEEAKRIGNRGAWAMAILGIIGFFAGVLVLRKIMRGIIAPVEEIRRVLEARLRGDIARRLFLKNVAPDFVEVGALINQMLALRTEKECQWEPELTRLALLHLMDASAVPMVLFSSKKEMIAANLAMENLLHGDDAAELKNLFAMASADPTQLEGIGWRAVDLQGRALLIQKAS